MDREPVGQFFEAGWETFKNNTNEEIPAHAVMRITGTTKVGQEFIINAEKPDSFGAMYVHRINGPVPVPAAKYGICRLNGLTAALYDTADGTPAASEMWGPRNGSWKLRRDTAGFRIVSTGNSGIVVVVHDPQKTLLGKTDAQISMGSTGTISIHWSGTGGSTVDTGENLTALSRYGTIAADKMVTVLWNGWGWEVIARECAS